MGPEEETRQIIDVKLDAAGWAVQDKEDIDLTAAAGVAVREFSLKAGHGGADYLLYADQKVIGVVEAKPFGHTGFLVRAGGIRSTVRSYFLLQQLAKAYAQQRVARVQYADADGRLLDTSAAVATGAYQRSQLKVTYADGLEVWVNGHPSQTWRARVPLAPNGFHALDRKRGLEVVSSADDLHRRADFVRSAAYVYCDGRGRFREFDPVAADEAVIGLKRKDGTVEVIPVGEPKVFAVGLGGRSGAAVALDTGRKELGAAETRLSRGLVFIVPRKGAFSYLLTPDDRPAVSLACDRRRVVPGETVTVREGARSHRLAIPADAKDGQIVWRTVDDAWIHFQAVPLADARLDVGEGKLRLHLRSNLPRGTAFVASLPGERRRARLAPGQWQRLDFPPPKLVDGQVEPIELKLSSGELSMRRKWWLEAKRGFRRLAELPSEFQAGQRFRGGLEGPLTAGSIAAARKDMSCGGVRKSGLFMHPPWRGGVGYSYALFGPVALPAEAPAALRCSIGKGDGSDPGDGILFRLAVVDDKGAEKVLAEKQWLRHAWGELTADLSKWAGRRVRIKLIADVGAKDNSSGDWACWAEMRIESAAPVVEITVHDAPPPRAKQKGPKP